jgi:hypothetical protein
LQEALAAGNDDELAQPNQKMVPGVGVEYTVLPDNMEVVDSTFS